MDKVPVVRLDWSLLDVIPTLAITQMEVTGHQMRLDGKNHGNSNSCSQYVLRNQ